MKIGIGGIARRVRGGRGHKEGGRRFRRWNGVVTFGRSQS
jgi:hypothetical protein